MMSKFRFNLCVHQEGFPFEGNVYNQIIGINLGNLVKGQLTHLYGKEIDELCCVTRVKGEGELVGHSLQQLIQWVARFVYTDKTKCKHGQHQI
jgi:hypothetical protein